MRTLLTAALITISMATYAQPLKEIWGNPSSEEFQMELCPIDPSADAAYLHYYGHYFFNRHYYFSSEELRTIYHYQVRMKIFTEEGKKYATVSIPFQGFDEYENVVEISGATYNLDKNGKVIKSKLKVKSAKWARNGRNLWYCTFTLPDVKVGSVLEYTYKVASLDFVKLRDWAFQQNLPVLRSNVVLSSPHFYQFAFFSNIPSHQLEVSKSDMNQYIHFYNTNIYTYGTDLSLSAKNIASFKKEEMMPDSSLQVLKGEFLLNTAITRPPEFTRFHDYYVVAFLKPLLLTTTRDYYEPRERIYLQTDIIGGYKIIEGMDWEAFIKKLSKQDGFGKEMLKAFENKELIDSFRKVEAGKKRMIAIYDYIRTNIKWNGQYRIFASSSLEKIYEKKTGYSSDINLLLINFLNRAGIQARPVLLSTRSYGEVYKELGFFRKFNHVIVSVELQGTRYLLDATDPKRPYNMLSFDDLNGEGLLVNLLDHEWIPLETSERSSINQSEKITILPDRSYKSEAVSTFTGFTALEKRNELLSSSSNLEKVQVENLQSEVMPLVIKFTNQGELKNDQPGALEFSPFSSTSLVNASFSESKRNNPIDLGFERVISSEKVISIPEGFSLASFPQTKSFSMKGDYVSCSLSTVLEQNHLILNLKMEVNNPFIPTRFYEDFKTFLEKVNQIKQEKVVLINNGSQG